MARNENPPFDRGQTFFGGGTVDSNNLAGLQLEGREWVFEDLDYSQTPDNPPRTQMQVRCRVVRNTSGIALLPKRLANLAKTAGKLGQRVDGYATVTGGRGYPIDEFLPSTGVPDKDLFWIVVDGPAKVITDLAALGAVINVGDYVMAQTAATSQATTAGRVVVQDLTGATAVLGQNAQGRIGNALSAVTTNNTNADLLVAVGKW